MLIWTILTRIWTILTILIIHGGFDAALVHIEVILKRRLLGRTFIRIHRPITIDFDMGLPVTRTNPAKFIGTTTCDVVTPSVFLDRDPTIWTRSGIGKNPQLIPLILRHIRIPHLDHNTWDWCVVGQSAAETD